MEFDVRFLSDTKNTQNTFNLYYIQWQTSNTSQYAVYLQYGAYQTMGILGPSAVGKVGAGGGLQQGSPGRLDESKKQALWTGSQLLIESKVTWQMFSV